MMKDGSKDGSKDDMFVDVRRRFSCELQCVVQFLVVRNDKIVTTAAIKFMAHLVNQKASRAR